MWKKALLVVLSAVIGTGAALVSMVLLSGQTAPSYDTFRFLLPIGAAIAIFFALPGSTMLLGVQQIARENRMTLLTEGLAVLVAGTVAGGAVLGGVAIFSGQGGGYAVAVGAFFGGWTAGAFVLLSRVIKPQWPKST